MWTTRHSGEWLRCNPPVPSDGHSNRKLVMHVCRDLQRCLQLVDGIRRSRLETRLAALCVGPCRLLGRGVRPPSVTLPDRCANTTQAVAHTRARRRI